VSTISGEDQVDTFTINGKSIDVVFSNVFKVRDGKIVYWQEHYDLTRLEDAFGKRIPVTEKPNATTYA
jgi:limonene-1,2-epoxide hydrolase